MIYIFFTGVGTISSFRFFQPEPLKQDEKKSEILDKSGDPACLDYFDQTDTLQAPYSDDHIEIAGESKNRGDDENFLNKLKRKTHQPQYFDHSYQHQETIYNIILDNTGRKSHYKYQCVDYYKTNDDL